MAFTPYGVYNTGGTVGAAHLDIAMNGSKKITRADAKGRVSLGANSAGREFVVIETRTGYRVEAVKTVVVPEDEAWLWQNPLALRMVLEGIEQSKAAKGRYLGSFEEFADVDPDE